MLLCRLGIHARVHAAVPSVLVTDLFRCRRCPARWRIGRYRYHWGVVRYCDRLADASGPYDHAAAVEAEVANAQAWARWQSARSREELI